MLNIENVRMSLAIDAKRVMRPAEEGETIRKSKSLHTRNTGSVDLIFLPPVPYLYFLNTPWDGDLQAFQRRKQSRCHDSKSQSIISESIVMAIMPKYGRQNNLRMYYTQHCPNLNAAMSMILSSLSYVTPVERAHTTTPCTLPNF